MKIPRLGIGLVIMALMAGAAAARDPVPVKREVEFTGEYVRGHNGMQRPKLIKSVPPKFPVQFRDARIPGQAIVEYIINADGVPEEVQFSSATDQAFGEAACAAVREWRYQPAMEGGKPVRNRTIQRIDFRLR
jgi:TonB family protein